ncbi:hypothetical protein HanXRQr2_Chr16g0768321 [Helianthus annuus]|uniref:Uncharacterized protein n=1 Tax=Helianthus annuus TaxID=4232 RepID=A0A251S236_HELAN|nr:hypothetical protein HanXRQr2_Chr16g0768321 [Helianthus annuus]
MACQKGKERWVICITLIGNTARHFNVVIKWSTAIIRVQSIGVRAVWMVKSRERTTVVGCQNWIANSHFQP